MQFDTQAIDEVARKIIQTYKDVIIVIKSTVNIGYTEYLRRKLNTKRIIFSPEFLREGHALEDNLYPSRVIVGGLDTAARRFGGLLREAANNSSVPVLFMEPTEAEAVKLFSNTYLAMRVAYFNELDAFCLDNKISTKDVIDGVSMDKRIGNFYNNPSFGFGGYCLPKDSKQLLQRFKKTPHDLIKAIQVSNSSRTLFLSEKIIARAPKTVGIYKLTMKKGSDNSRGSSIFGIIQQLLAKKINIVVFDQSIKELEIPDLLLLNDFKKFTEISDLIIANRLDNEILPFSKKIFSRDIFSSDE
jgi:UDPglucose 6-dehydrogenase